MKLSRHCPAESWGTSTKKKQRISPPHHNQQERRRFQPKDGGSGQTFLMGRSSSPGNAHGGRRRPPSSIIRSVLPPEPRGSSTPRTGDASAPTTAVIRSRAGERGKRRGPDLAARSWGNSVGKGITPPHLPSPPLPSGMGEGSIRPSFVSGGGRNYAGIPLFLQKFSMAVPMDI